MERKELELFEFDIKNKRPEEYVKDPIEYFGNKDTLKKYSESKSMKRIQEKLTMRALEMLDFLDHFRELKNPSDANARILDIGMGCGYSSDLLYNYGFQVVGIDIVYQLLTVKHKKFDLIIPNSNPIQLDMRDNCFRKSIYDYIISISAAQWLLTDDKELKRKKNIKKFVKLCVNSLKVGGKLVIQFYPKSDELMHELGSGFNMTKRFEGGFIIDNPENKVKRKIFLLLTKVA